MVCLKLSFMDSMIIFPLTFSELGSGSSDVRAFQFRRRAFSAQFRSPCLINSSLNLVSRPKWKGTWRMDSLRLQRSSTEGTLSTTAGSNKLGNWLSALGDRRKNKKSMKASKSITLGERSISGMLRGFASRHCVRCLSLRHFRVTFFSIYH